MSPRRSQPPPGPAVPVARVGLIGDVHTEHVRLAGVLGHFAREQLDRVVCTGDVPDGPNDAEAVDRCCALLRERAVLTISGNHDRWLQDAEMRDLDGATDRDELAKDTLSFLASLPPTLELSTPLGSVLVCHGMGNDDMAGVQPFDHGLALEGNHALQRVLRAQRYRYVIAGHTHRPMVRVIDGLTIINAGTLLSLQQPCCSIIDFGARSVQFYDVADDGTLRPGQRLAL